MIESVLTRGRTLLACVIEMHLRVGTLYHFESEDRFDTLVSGRGQRKGKYSGDYEELMKNSEKSASKTSVL